MPFWDAPQRFCFRSTIYAIPKHETAQTHSRGVCVCAECRQSRLAAAVVVAAQLSWKLRSSAWRAGCLAAWLDWLHEKP